mgnify:FL=1|tara:strand:- start:4590 stop:4928 length:339 start_codon:yes stop_codon:yes gene_type:complete
MTDRFYESDQVKDEIKEMEKLYMDLARLSTKFPTMDDETKLEHLEKTMMLIAKQKVFYARLCLMSHEDEEALAIKLKIDEMSKVYSNGRNIDGVLTDMEEQLRQFRKQLDKA